MATNKCLPAFRPIRFWGESEPVRDLYCHAPRRREHRFQRVGGRRRALRQPPLYGRQQRRSGVRPPALTPTPIVAICWGTRLVLELVLMSPPAVHLTSNVPDSTVSLPLATPVESSRAITVLSTGMVMQRFFSMLLRLLLLPNIVVEGLLLLPVITLLILVAKVPYRLPLLLLLLLVLVLVLLCRVKSSVFLEVEVASCRRLSPSRRHHPAMFL